MRVLALLPIAAAVSTQDRIASMQSTLRNIAATAQKAGKIDEDTKEAVRGFMATMNSTLVESLIKETEANQGILTAAFNAVEACSTARDDAFAGDVTTKAGTRDAARTTLGQSKNCGDGCPNGKANNGRGAALIQAKTKLPAGHNYSYDIDGRHWGNEDVAFNTEAEDPFHKAALAKSTCDSNEANKCEGECDCWKKMDAKCNELNTMVRGFDGKTRAEPDFCEDSETFPSTTKPGAHPHTETIASRDYYNWEATKADADPVFVWFSFMEAFTENHVQNYKDTREECHDLRNIHQHRVFDSHRKQKQFEQDFCAWAHAIDVHCGNYANCYTTKNKLFNDQKAIIEGEEAQFKKQQQALECALCYGNQILQDTTDLTACDRETGCVNCEPLDIDYPTPHAQRPCDEEAVTRPCDAEWIAAEYGCWESYYPPDECTACA